jgi:hypothetical protein
MNTKTRKNEAQGTEENRAIAAALKGARGTGGENQVGKPDISPRTKKVVDNALRAWEIRNGF